MGGRRGLLHVRGESSEEVALKVSRCGVASEHEPVHKWGESMGWEVDDDVEGRALKERRKNVRLLEGGVEAV